MKEFEDKLSYQELSAKDTTLNLKKFSIDNHLSLLQFKQAIEKIGVEVGFETIGSFSRNFINLSHSIFEFNLMQMGCSVDYTDYKDNPAKRKRLLFVIFISGLFFIVSVIISIFLYLFFSVIDFIIIFFFLCFFLF